MEAEPSTRRQVRAGWRDRSLVSRPAWALWIGFLVAASWPVSELRPLPTLDESAEAAFHLARLDGLHWGSEIVWTYGPLGFLAYPKAFSAIDLLLPAIYAALALGSFAGVVAWQLNRRYGVLVAVAGSFLLISLLPLPGRFWRGPGYLTDVAVLTALAIGVSALAGEISPRRARWLPAAFGAAAGCQVLVKMSPGLAIAGLGALIALVGVGPRFRRFLEFFYAFVIALLLLWVVLGQPLSDFPLWVRRALSEAAGFPSGAGDEEAGRHWEYLAAVLFPSALLALGSRGLRLPLGCRRWPLLLLAGGAAWFFFREGFTRHDGAHTAVFFTFLIVIAVALPWRSAWRIPAAVLVAAASAALMWSSGSNAPRWFNFAPSLRSVGKQFDAIASAAERAKLLDSARGVVSNTYPVPQPLLALVGNEPVHVEVGNATIAWAYHLNWRPVPLFEAYAAYTHELDVANAHWLLNPDGPTRVLRIDTPAVDGRYHLQENPEYTLALVCNFVQAGADGGWELLARGENRCGNARQVGETQLRNGELVAVPQPSTTDALVVGRIHVTLSAEARLRALLLKAPPGSLVVNGTRYRFVPGTAEGPLLLRLPAGIGWSPDFGRPVDTNSIGLVSFPGSARISFYEIPIRIG
jgi:hypothetical protein